MKSTRWSWAIAMVLLACSNEETETEGGGRGGQAAVTTATTSSGSTASVTSGAGGDGGAGGQAPQGIVWGACPEGFRDECATVKMPLDHADPTGEKIDVFLSRHGNGSKQLWMLQGGPGASAEVFANWMPFLDMVDPDLQIFTIEHRGVGESTRLGCAAEGSATPGGFQILPEEWPSCQDELVATWGDRLRFFSATQAAHDLASAIDATRKPGQKVFVFGGSYGTTWANRYAVYHPDQPDGVILDAPSQPDATLERYDLQFEPIGRTVFGELCLGAPACTEHLGADPGAFLDDAFAALEGGRCSELGVDIPTWKVVFGIFLMDYNLRNWLPALVYRLNRCSDADKQAIATLFSKIFGGGSGIPRRSFALQVHIVLSELWPAGHVDSTDVDLAREQNIFFQDALAPQYQLQDTWPKYAHDPRSLEYAPPNVPFLVMAGSLDPATPPAAVGYGYRDNLLGPAQTFVEMPYQAHGVLRAAPVASGPSCPVQLVRQFLADPASELPVDCAADVLHPSLDAPQDLAMQFFGTPDIYD